MRVFKGSPLGELPCIRDVRTCRESSWDCSGGNDGFLVIKAGETASLANIRAAGCINHLWCTHWNPQSDALRRLVMRMRWDNEEAPSVEVPLGDFFGVGLARMVSFTSLPLQMSPADGRAFNCWFPMPFDTRAETKLVNESDEKTNFYYFVDYEMRHDIPEDFGQFHAQWHRENPCDGISGEGVSNEEFSSDGLNIGGKGNYVILEAEGKWHYVGFNLNIHNLRKGERIQWPGQMDWPLKLEQEQTHPELLSESYNWYGEGDDMIFIDGEEWPPSLHGTGSEDYFNTAYCPAVKYDAPYHGMTMPGRENWAGKISVYRFHIEDPIHFQKSIRVAIENGHANRRSDDYSSTAYWYQLEPYKQFSPLPPVQERLP